MVGRLGLKGPQPAGAAGGAHGGAGKVAVGDGGVEDGAKQRQIGVDRARRELLGQHAGLPACYGVSVQLGQTSVAEDGQDALVELLLGGVGRAGMVALPAWSPGVNGCRAELARAGCPWNAAGSNRPASRSRLTAWASALLV